MLHQQWPSHYLRLSLLCAKKMSDTELRLMRWKALSKSSHPKPICTNCKRLGHSMENCHSKGGSKEGQAHGGRKRKQTRTARKWIAQMSHLNYLTLHMFSLWVLTPAPQGRSGYLTPEPAPTYATTMIASLPSGPGLTTLKLVESVNHMLPPLWATATFTSYPWSKGNLVKSLSTMLSTLSRCRSQPNVHL